MIIPATAIIEVEKVRDYLLVARAKGDKARFLARAGYFRDNYQRLIVDIRSLLPAEAMFQELTPYGSKYRLMAVLKGPNGLELAVRTIWQRNDESEWRFITLYPDRR